MQARLGRLMNGSLVSLTLTDNRSRIISARRAGKGYAVRIHRCFEQAAGTTLRSVAAFVTGSGGRAGRRRALTEIRRHFEACGPPPGEASPRTAVLRPEGRCYDLREVCDDLNGRFFAGGVEASITWGRAPARRRRRRGAGYSIRLGVYVHDDRLIRIHPTLDRPEVPRYVVESVVYHEMLHAVIPPVEGPGGRRRLHPPEFQRRERLFPRYEEAERWIHRHLGRLAGFD